ncbi:anaerobic C4-dicarboxylate transporter family protein [Salisediminibacterium halotolerans]|uniref:anaerobic C4-dicarboxylate transporter family protein n=1 Tax=Salisediminibacterium halotolerans TaxID=517425 RepID=UPI000EB09241|nr:anaerobic C4-dicarboxylate transporter [Salisediminibacterium halotolerans]RLJ71809.1 anaerobic C4-dicarboxylate transporter DcuA/anaerobic C4-dicarboxylate transporter DcuB [Actinophytocola xinjiangensis]RPE86959.1 anaerobic C4-dicarboxylate transporter DcuA/anaerobic C4-dicarboxylate transporter DcuB [Salisediminibacterium halotolerans]TWG33022.1 anaerobic C4-dicarboxylate transporter DcuA/anaerobic C4-dicarboxylate transporter DcuB [Salisediminibacterium halotolerans]GEL08919.1 C4-dicarbo
MFFMQLLLVLIAIFIGARIGGIGLGVMGGVGLGILTFGFGLEPTSPPIDVMLMIVAVITAASALQASGGMNYLVSLAEKVLRKNPSRITFMAPIVTYTFTFFAGTGHVAYTLLPVISEVAQESKVRPERPLSIAVIASQQAITASPISAATVALLALIAPYDLTLMHILGVTIPATLLGVMTAAFLIRRRGPELEDDPEYNHRLKEGLLPARKEREKEEITGRSKLSVALFLTGAVMVVLFGSFEQLRPSFESGGEITVLSMPDTIQIVMLTIAALIIVLCKADVHRVASGSVMRAGIVAVIAIFGIAWMGDTFIEANMDTIEPSLQGVAQAAPWMFAFALFMMSILLNSQAATVQALMPLGLSIGINPIFMIAMFPAVNGYFFIPNYGPIIAAIGFDRTGTTKIGKYVLNHSFMIPGLVTITTAVALGFLFITVLL